MAENVADMDSPIQSIQAIVDEGPRDLYPGYMPRIVYAKGILENNGKVKKDIHPFHRSPSKVGRSIVHNLNANGRQISKIVQLFPRCVADGVTKAMPDTKGFSLPTTGSFSTL